jgi:hypothetical protein
LTVILRRVGEGGEGYTVKKRFVIFPSPAGMSLTKLSLGGNNDVVYKLFPPRESLVSDIPAGDGKIVNLFLQCNKVICIYFWPEDKGSATMMKLFFIAIILQTIKFMTLLMSFSENLCHTV